MNDAFQKKFDEDGCPLSCDCCFYDAPLIEYGGRRERARGESRPVNLCEVCYNTHLSKTVLYPSQVADPALYRSVAWIANRILAAISDLVVER